MKVCFETFGCRLNRAEALDREAECIARGWKVVHSHADADVFIVRGCSVTERAQRDTERLIEHLKRKYPLKKIIVEGCIKAEENLFSRKASLDAKIKDSSKIPVLTRTARAYLKVQDGCNGKCTFCIVPQFRGKSRSVPFEQVLDKAKLFIEAGYREIVVTGCNLSLYASDGKKLPELLDALSSLDSPNGPGGCRIRIGSLTPGDCASDVIQLMAERNSICRFLHVPVQSGSAKILSAMGRLYTVKDVENLAAKALELMPHIALGCDLMTGFPGETEMDFLATKGLLKRIPFSNAHIFPFSKRPGTVAAALPSAVPVDVRRARAHLLANISLANRLKFAQKFIGKIVEIVVEDQDSCAGWTSEYLPCKANGFAFRKTIAKILVTRAHRDASLEGLLRRQSEPARVSPKP